MKSIMEEASSIVKAIETAWNRAGKPTEFSIKVLEHPESSLFGLKTVKSAKIAFYFNEQTVKQPQKQEIQARPMRQPQAPRPAARPVEGEPSERPAQERERRPERMGQQDRRDRYQQRGQDRRSGRGDYQRRDRRDQRDGGYDRYADNEPRDNWSPEMVTAAQEWLKETLSLMGHQDIQINSSVSGGYLKLLLDKPISEDSRQEELQLKSWGNLIIESLREKVNKPLRGLRVIIESRR